MPEIIHAAGIMLLCKAGGAETALFVKRGPGSDSPGLWAFPGGRQEPGETIEECAERETREEIGSAPYGDLKTWTRRIATQETTGAPPTPPTGPEASSTPAAAPVAPGQRVDFTTFMARAKSQFTPTLNGEHTAWAWANVETPPEPLHPGCRVALQRLKMDELGIARAMAAGELTSPQRYENITLFALRITGTQLAYRDKWKEYAWRDGSIYLTEDMIARCNGLPVVWQHPPDGILNTKEFRARIIGTIMMPYVADDDDGVMNADGQSLWGISRIWDIDAALEMESKQLSTSPGVDIGKGNSFRMISDDGKVVLIEANPKLVDHLAVCAVGVWDKTGPPLGVLNNSLPPKDNLMAADSTAADAAVQSNVDKLLTRMDAVTRRMDDADKHRKDAARRRADRFSFPKRRADDDDDAHRRRMDAAEEEMGEYLEDACEEDARGKARDARRKADEAEDKLRSADAARRRSDDDAKRRRMDDDAGGRRRRADDDARATRADDDDDDDKHRARMDAEEAEEREKLEREGEAADAAADAARRHRADKDVWRADRRARRADDARHRRMDDALATMPKRDDAADAQACSDAQVRANPAYREFGKEAPVAMQAETPTAYRRRLARSLQQHSSQWKDIDLSTINDAALTVAENTIYADAITAARNPSDFATDDLVALPRTDPVSGHRIIEFRGRRTWINDLRAPARSYVTAFNNPRWGH